MLTSHMLRIYQKHIYTHNIHHAYTTQAANLSKTYLYHSGHTTNQPVVIPHLIYSEDLTSGKYHLPCISTTVIPHLRWRSYHSGHSVIPQTKLWSYHQLTYGHTTLSLKLLNFCKTKLQLNKRSQLFIINTVWYDLPTWSYSAQRTCAASALNWSSLLGLLFYVFANRTARSLGCLATLGHDHVPASLVLRELKRLAAAGDQTFKSNGVNGWMDRCQVLHCIPVCS